MQDERKDIYQAAEVILLIIKHEGEIEEAIEYPPEFEDAYVELLNFKIIKQREGKYLPDENFEKASKQGFKKYVENLSKTSQYKKLIANKPALGIIAGAIILTAGFLLKPDKNPGKTV